MKFAFEHFGVRPVVAFVGAGEDFVRHRLVRSGRAVCHSNQQFFRAGRDPCLQQFCGNLVRSDIHDRACVQKVDAQFEVVRGMGRQQPAFILFFHGGIRINGLYYNGVLMT